MRCSQGRAPITNTELMKQALSLKRYISEETKVFCEEDNNVVASPEISVKFHGFLINIKCLSTVKPAYKKPKGSV